MEMGLKHHQNGRNSSSSSSRFLCFTYITTLVTTALFFTYLILLLLQSRELSNPSSSFDGLTGQPNFDGDLRAANFPWNKLCFGPTTEKLKLAAFSKSWPIGTSPGGMERHAATLYRALAARGHEVHVFTVPSDRKRHEEIREGTMHVHFASNDHGSVNLSLAFEIFNRVNSVGHSFDYVHTESVSLSHYRAKNLNVAVTWHGIWYEIMHSKLFRELHTNLDGNLPGPASELQEAMPRLLDEIRFFPSYTQHISISNSMAEVLINIYQLPQRNVHIILNGVDESKFEQNPNLGARFRLKHGIPTNASVVMGVAGRLVRDKGHPLLYHALSSLTKRHPGLFLLVAGSGPWASRYAELGPTVKVLGPLGPSELSGFYNALDVFVNPTMRPQGLDLTLIEAMHCGKPVLAPNFPSIVGNVILNEEFGYSFSPNVRSLVEALETALRDGPEKLKRKGMACKEYARTMFTSTKMASAYERFFLCMKNPRYCQYPLSSDC